MSIPPSAFVELEHVFYRRLTSGIAELAVKFLYEPFEPVYKKGANGMMAY
jgi:hypothetical protein